MEKSRSSSGVAAAASEVHTDLEIIFDFFTDNPQKVMPGDVNSPKRDSPFYDPYWEAIRAMQGSENFLEGVLLRSVDCKPRYPYVHYVVYKNLAAKSSPSSKPKFGRGADADVGLEAGIEVGGSGGGGGGGVGDTQSQHNDGRQRPTSHLDKEFIEILKNRGGYRELHTFVDRQTPLLPKRPSNPNTAYILSAFMTSGNLDNLDKTWSYWSGADYIVENIPSSLKLERVTFHKVMNSAGAEADRNGFSYVLLCELGEALADLNRAREFIDHLKFRQCGISSLYIIDHLF